MIPNDNIITIEELNQYINQYVVLYYYKDYNKDMGTTQRPNLPIENVSFMWMFKLIPENKDINTDDKKTIRGTTIYGKDFVCLVDSQHTTKTAPYIMDERHNGYSTAQSYARTPTKQEMITYMNLMRHKRIFGY